MEIKSEDWEVISFFSNNPTLTDRDAPWCYNRISFQTETESGLVSCTLEPGDDYFHIVVDEQSGTGIDIELTTVEYVEVHEFNDMEWLVVSTKHSPQMVLMVRLSPSVSVRFRVANDENAASLVPR